MKATEIKIIENTFHLILPISDAAGKLFYLKLFELDPNLKNYFSNDMFHQEIKFMNLVENAVHFINDMSLLRPNLKAIGTHHADCGIRPEHYHTAEIALMWTLEQLLDKEFTPRVEMAWKNFYKLLIETMKSATEKAA